MWLVDSEFLSGVVNSDKPYVTTVRVPRDRPYFDIEVVSDVRLIKPAAEEFVERFKRLRRPFNEGRPSHLLVSCGDLASTSAGSMDWFDAFERIRPLVPELLAVPGNLDIYRGTSDQRPHEWFGTRFLKNREVPELPCGAPVTSISRVCIDGDPIPFAYVAVIGFDSNLAGYKNRHITDHGQVDDAQLDTSLELIKLLTRTVARNTPLYVIGVTHHHLIPARDGSLTGPVDWAQLDSPTQGWDWSGDPPARHSARCAANHLVAECTAGGTVNSSAFLSHCRQVRMSMVVHAQMHRRDVTTMSSTPLLPGEGPAEISVVACPSFTEESSMAGLARIRVNVWKAEAEIAFSYEDDRDGQNRSIQIVRQLLSASRITAPERRLYHAVRSMLAKRAEPTPEHEGAGISMFRDYVDQTWDRTGYVALCQPDGSLPGLPVHRRTKYFLLLLLRERAGGAGFDILLNNHTSLRPSQLGDWSTLLLPAFKDVRTLLEHLRDDVLRQVVDRAEDLEKARHVRQFEEAIGRILNDTGSAGEDIWDDQLCEIAMFKKQKISPTSGCVTEYEYRLVTLLPLVRRPDRRPPSPVGPASIEARQADEERRHDFNTIMAWLDELPSVRRRSDRATGPVVPIESLHVRGGGLRWEPEAYLGDEPSPVLSVLRRVPPGAIWFPVPNPDDDPSDSMWRQCPSIVARNADVMAWLDRDLAVRRQLGGGSFPPELIVGKLAQERSVIELVGNQFPFAPVGSHEATADTPAGSTVEALAKVKFMEGYDLDGEHPYEGLVPKRVFLIRQDVPVWRGSRSVILIFDATAYERTSVPYLRHDAALGILRPVQRYVLRAGLVRARELYDQVLAKLDDEWGFVRIRKDKAPKAVTVTPPIIEQLHPDDWEDERGEREYIVCDGNHRVVELVWNLGIVLPAIAVVGTPSQPYYARPFSRYEWSYTAENVQDTSPDQVSKYAVRKVELSSLDAASAATLAGLPAADRYRRYYRDLTTGFGYLGGQGGRYV